MTEHEITEICQEYKFERQAFTRFLSDYFVILNGELPPSPDDPVDREFEEVARLVGLPAYVVRRAKEEGALSDPITSGDLDALRSVKVLFGKTWFVRAQLTKCRKSERQRLIQRPELELWERWAYTTFIRHKAQREADCRSNKQGEKLHLASMLRTIEGTFGVGASEVVKNRLLQVRKMSANDFYAAKKRGLDPEVMVRRRGVDPVGPEE